MNEEEEEEEDGDHRLIFQRWVLVIGFGKTKTNDE